MGDYCNYLGLRKTLNNIFVWIGRWKNKSGDMKATSSLYFLVWTKINHLISSKLWLKATTQSYKTAIALKMRKASSPHPPYTNPTKQVSNLQYELSKRPSKNRSVLSYVKTAFKRVVGAFTILLPRKSKADDIVNDAGKSNKQVGGISCKLSS